MMNRAWTPMEGWVWNMLVEDRWRTLTEMRRTRAPPGCDGSVFRTIDRMERAGLVEVDRATRYRLYKLVPYRKPESSG